jgi:hypothetical protein
MMSLRLFHISETAGIERFDPRPSPSFFSTIRGDFVFGISGNLLHNYLLPRDCPRVTYYTGPGTTVSDRQRFFEFSSARFVVAIEAAWLQRVYSARLYRYEFSVDGFELLDEVAGYYVSYSAVTPLSEQRIDDCLSEILLSGDVELRVVPELWSLGKAVAGSSLGYSLIRMRNAKKA